MKRAQRRSKSSPIETFGALAHLIGINHKQRTRRDQARDFRLTDVHGHVVKGLLASSSLSASVHRTDGIAAVEIGPCRAAFCARLGRDTSRKGAVRSAQLVTALTTAIDRKKCIANSALTCVACGNDCGEKKGDAQAQHHACTKRTGRVHERDQSDA